MVDQPAADSSASATTGFEPAAARQVYELLDHPVLWARCGADGKVRVSDLNAAACEWLGCRKRDTVGRALEAVCPAGWGPQWVEQHRIALRTGASICWAAPVPVSGTGAPAQIRLLAVAAADGAREIVSVVRHVPRALLEQGDLRRTTALLQAIVDQQPECVKLLDSDGTVVQMNRAGLAMLGVPDVASANRIGLIHFVHPGDRERFSEFHRAVCAGQSGQLRFRLRSTDGRVLHIESRATPLRDPISGRLRHLAVTRDLTASVEAMAALERSEHRLEFVLRAARIGTGSLDLRSGRATCSREFERCLGHADDSPDWTSELFFAHLHPDDRERARVALEHAIAGTDEMDGEYRVPWPDGSQHWIWLRAALEREDGEPARLSGIVVDISARKAIEQALVELNADLEARVAERTRQLLLSNQELRTFTYSVSHDLRAPLRGILGWCEALEQDCASALGEEGQAHLRRVREEARRMSEQVEGLLRLARIAQSDLELTDIDVSALAQDIAQRLAGEHPARVVDVCVQPGMRIRADRPLLELALANLIGNAFKFSAARTPARIAVRTTPGPGEWVLEVVDNGVGFDPQRAGELFLPFARLHAVSEFAGTGIGLAIVERILRRHGGHASASGAREAGACFRLHFPVPG